MAGKLRWGSTLLVMLGVLSLSACRPGQAEESQKVSASEGESSSGKLETATFGSGCFWCTEAVFQRLEGVEKVVSGYTGGHVENPTYEQVCTGLTGHAEVIQIQYDPEKISYTELLEVFWKTHDPTTPNRQGPDVGPQYRSAVFYHNGQQREQAEKYKQKLDAAQIFNGPIVTEITAIEKFYAAEEYHQNYFNENRRQSYCRFLITPKIKKFEAVFRDKLKESSDD